MSRRAARWLAWSPWALTLMAIVASVVFQILNASTQTGHLEARWRSQSGLCCFSCRSRRSVLWSPPGNLGT